MRVLLALACVLALATPAHAECAWVLWTALVLPAVRDEGPIVVTAFPTTKECEAALAEQFSRLKSEGWNPSYPQVRTVMAFKGKGEIMVATHYRCLPDTVDPRGPKGK